jgi:hypothetical protein
MTAISTFLTSQSSCTSTLTAKAWPILSPLPGDRKRTVGLWVSSMHPNADGFGPPGQSPSTFFIMRYEFCVSRSHRSPVTGLSPSTKPIVSVLIVGNMMSCPLLVCSSPTRCACSWAMMTAVSRALRPPWNVYATPPARSLHRNGATPATLSSTLHHAPPPDETTSV